MGQLLANVQEHGSASELLWAHEHPAHALEQEQRAVAALLTALGNVRAEWFSPAPNTNAPAAASAGAPSAPEPAAPSLSSPVTTAVDETSGGVAEPLVAAEQPGDAAEQPGVAGAAPEPLVAGAAGEPSAATAVPAAGSAAPVNRPPSALELLAVSARDRAVVQQTVASIETQALPRLDAQLTATERDLYRNWSRTRTLLTPKLQALVCTPKKLRRRKLLRVTLAGIWTTLVMSLAAYAVISWAGGVSVRTSGEFAPTYPGSAIVDGNPSSEWLLPGGQAGWVEVTFNRARSLKKVRVLNAHNPPHNDRATKKFQVLAFNGDKQVALANQTFPAASTTPTWLGIPLAANNVTRLRIFVQSFHGLGGGIAEISWE